jgi:hypothetical protein
MPANKWFAASPNTDYIFKALTDGTVNKLSNGRIPKMNAQQAAGLIGSWVIETGRKDLGRLDVVEAGSGRGRGLSQYTGVRRVPYDQAASAARTAGKDPNSAQWQLEYFAKEYLNRDLIGWTQVFEKMPKVGTPETFARYFTGSAQEGKGYFRPGTPHQDRRNQAASEVYRHYASQDGSSNSKAQQGLYNPNSVGKQGPAFDPSKMSIKGPKQSQTFNTDKIATILGQMASVDVKADVGFAIFGSNKKSLPKAWKEWNNLPNKTKAAWQGAAKDMGLSIKQFSGKGPVQLPPTLTYQQGAASTFQPSSKPIQTSSGSRPAYSTQNNTTVGGLPGLDDIAQAGVGNIKHFQGKSVSYSDAAFSKGFHAGEISSRSYGTSLDLGQSLGIRGGAGSASAAAASGGYTWGSTASAGGAWKGNFSYSK